MKKVLQSVLLTALMTLFMSMQVFAQEAKTEVVNVVEQDPQAPAATVVSANAVTTTAAVTTGKPILALGANLTPDQQATVLGLMGITVADLPNYQVISITNDMEHHYLDAYISPSVIGTKSLSSVMITPKEAGHGVLVTTKNINYCTTGMYRNALLTAGVSDADVLVVGPSEISGTAALIGAIKAYEVMSGTVVPEATLDTALNELVTTGSIATKSASPEEVEALVAFIKAKIATGELENEDDIRKAIKEGEEKFGVTLGDEEIQQIVDLMLKIKALGLDPNKLVDQAADLYEKFGDDFVNHLDEAGFFQSVGDFFKEVGTAIGDFFKGLFK